MDLQYRSKRTLSSVKRQFSYRTPIKPFVSSTFQDFHEERDYLIKRIFPQLDTLCHQRGTYFAPVDLRWGINDAQTKDGNVIRLCLEYINRCDPYFICLLGDRYGSHRPPNWPPLCRSLAELGDDGHWLDRNFLVASSGGYEWILQESHDMCSVTELEIIQAAFRNQSQFCFFYFRIMDVDDSLLEPPPAEQAEKLQLYFNEKYGRRKMLELKQRIISNGFQVKHFSTCEELGQHILTDWIEVIETLYPSITDPIADVGGEQFMEWMAHETFAESRRRVFVPTADAKAIYRKLTEFASGCEGVPLRVISEAVPRHKKMSTGAPITHYSILLLSGDRGCGKTSVVAYWVKQFSNNHPDIVVLSHFVGCSALSTDCTSFMRRCIYELRLKYSGQGGNVSVAREDLSDFHRVSDAFIAALCLGPSLLVLDGINELASSLGLTANQVKEMSWLPVPLPAQCHLIVTSTISEPITSQISSRPDTETLKMQGLTCDMLKRRVMEEHLAMHCKALNEDQLERIVKSKLSETPLCLALLANELRIFGHYCKLDSQLDIYLSASSIRELWSRIIQRWTKDYGWKSREFNGDRNCEDGVGWVPDALRLIAVSRHGLTSVEIVKILKTLGYTGISEVKVLDVALLRSAALDSLCERPSGLINFLHQHLQEAVNHDLLGCKCPSSQQNCDERKNEYNCYLAAFFMDQPHSERRTQELPWQMEQSENYKGLSKVISEPKVFLSLYGDITTKQTGWLDLHHYWRCLSLAGYDPTIIYENMVTLAMDEAKKMELVLAEEDSVTSEVESNQDLAVYEVAILASRAGRFLSHLGHFTSSENLLLKAYNMLIQMSPLKLRELQSLVQTEESIANLYLYQLKTQEAEIWYRKALRTFDELMQKLSDFGSDGILTIADILSLRESKGRLLKNLSRMKIFVEQYNEANTLLEEAEENMDTACSTTGIASVQYNKGILRMKQNIFEEAETCFRFALDIRERWYGKSHPLVAEVIDDLANLLWHPLNPDKVDRKEAEALYRQALFIREQSLGPSHLLTATSTFRLAKLLTSSDNENDKKEAIHLCKRALYVRTTKLGSTHCITKNVQDHLRNLQHSMQSLQIEFQPDLGKKSPSPQTVDHGYNGLISWDS